MMCYYLNVHFRGQKVKLSENVYSKKIWWRTDLQGTCEQCFKDLKYINLQLVLADTEERTVFVLEYVTVNLLQKFYFPVTCFKTLRI